MTITKAELEDKIESIVYLHCYESTGSASDILDESKEATKKLLTLIDEYVAESEIYYQGYEQGIKDEQDCLRNFPNDHPEIVANIERKARIDEIKEQLEWIKDVSDDVAFNLEERIKTLEKEK